MVGWLIIIAFLAVCAAACVTVVLSAAMLSSTISQMEEEARHD